MPVLKNIYDEVREHWEKHRELPNIPVENVTELLDAFPPESDIGLALAMRYPNG